MIDKIIELFDKGYCNECNELNCLGGEPSSKTVANAIRELKQENEQLKEQLTNNSKINIADHKYASECEDKIIELENQLKQRDGVIDELEEFLKAFHNYENRFKWCEQDYIDTIEKFEEILQKYKGAKNNE